MGATIIMCGSPLQKNKYKPNFSVFLETLKCDILMKIEIDFLYQRGRSFSSTRIFWSAGKFNFVNIHTFIIFTQNVRKRYNIFYSVHYGVNNKRKK